MNIELLRAIANASAANTVVYVDAPNGKPLLDAGYITVDMNNKDAEGKIAATITDAGVTFLNGQGVQQPAGKSVSHASFQVQTAKIELPKIKRGGSHGGAPTKYPFDTLEVGQFFFVANSAVDKGDAVKTLGSAAGAANQRYSEPVVENGVVKMKQVTRAKRGEGNKAIKDPATGKNVTETVMVEEKRQTRHFAVRPVKAGVQYGEFTAPADGAVVVRMPLKPETATAA